MSVFMLLNDKSSNWSHKSLGFESKTEAGRGGNEQPEQKKSGEKQQYRLKNKIRAE